MVLCTSAVHEREAAESGCRKKVWGKYRERTMNQTENSGVTACANVSRRYVDLASQIDITSTHPVSSLVQDWMGCYGLLAPPARINKGGKGEYP